MSGIFSTFIIDPVVRQARRFSSQGSSSSASRPAISSRAPELQSHVNTCDATASTNNASTTAAHFSPALGIRHDLVIADGSLPSVENSCSVSHNTAATGELSAGADDLDRRRTTSVPVTQHPLPAAASAISHPDLEDAILVDGAVDSIEESPVLTPNDVPIIDENLLQPPVSAYTNRPPDTAISEQEDVNMAPPPPPTRQGRTSSARDIPRPQMSLREDSPSQAVRSLPADDGMRLLRQKIHQIRELNTSQVEKARRMHELMTEEWQAAQMALRPQSPASMISQENGRVGMGGFVPSSPLSTITMPTSPESVASLPAPTTAVFAPPVDPQNPFNVQPEDLQASYRPLPQESDNTQSSEDLPHDENTTPSSSDPPEPVLGCKHYKRNVKIQCHDCREWHSCRHCHDANVATHHLNRKATENMLCMLCWTPQAAGQYCKECGGRAAWYYCDICKLWDDDASKSIYHCPDCGICRRGEGLGKDFVHCKKCNVCISIAHYATHTCIENATDSNCPLCLDYMFTSPLEIVAMPCGHYLHHHCYTSLMLSTYQCPICKRSAVNMETQWRKLEEEIRHQPMPREWSDVKVEVKCNDCAALTVAPFHWLGVKCGRCDGFNTGTVRMMAENEEVRRDVQDFAEQRRERRADIARETFRRTNTAPVIVRPYFLDEEDQPPPGAGERPRSARPSYTLPELPQFRYPNINLAEYRGRLPNMPNMPALPNMPGFAFPFDLGVLDRVNRGLSPIRHYFDDQIADGVPRQFRMLPDGSVRTSIEGEGEAAWRRDEHWMVESSDEEEDEEDEEDTEGEYDEDEDSDEEMIDVDDEEDEAADDRLRIELTGHR